MCLFLSLARSTYVCAVHKAFFVGRGLIEYAVGLNQKLLKLILLLAGGSTTNTRWRALQRQRCTSPRQLV